MPVPGAVRRNVPCLTCACAGLRQTYVYLAHCMAGPLPMEDYWTEYAGGRSLLRFDFDPALPSCDLPLGAPWRCTVW